MIDRSKLRTVAAWVLASTGTLAILLLGLGIFSDVRSFDPTRGGYDPPYTEYTGEPIDWSQTYQTSTGMYASGYVVSTHVDCRTGMITAEIFGLRFDYRELSDRAVAVHEPREACEERGFSPEF
ncbi:MAG: hypothetical protein EA415_14000 [Sphaerobacteraceae bacterium]|nr:MAG: hypothetical protein EA415_14000 [Sphaerobacteraceae bacterium]